jgi:acetoacetyl-CoA synthetase
MTVVEGELLWTPPPQFAARSNLAGYMRGLAERGRPFADYESLRHWSVSEPDAFWASIWEHFEVRSPQPYTSVRSRAEMPGTRWFSGARVNYAEHVLRHEETRAADVAVIARSETRAEQALTWGDVGAAVRALATALRERGVGKGDHVAAYLPNIPETLVAMLATVSIGAVWSSAAPDFGAPFVIDRFAQLDPAVLFVADGYRFSGKDYDRSREAASIVDGLPAAKLVVSLAYLHPEERMTFATRSVSWDDLLASGDSSAVDFAYEGASESDPLWVLFSSGTTGLPKAIVHSHAGILVESFKNLGFHANLGPASTMFFYTTTGWMMWNALVTSLLLGARIVLYDGHPLFPDAACLWRIASETGTTCFGGSPTFVKMMQQAGVTPARSFDLSKLESVFLSGSPATPETFAWMFAEAGRDLWVTSQSGGTEFCSGLCVGVPILPVYAGEIQARTLGIDVQVWNDEGRPVTGEVGELVVTAPAPSMPLRLLRDEGDARYRATYFDRYPGVWRHGDFAKVNARGGCYVYGRSDATLNRFGVRIGSAEIYRAIEELDDVADALIVCLELPDGGFYMPLFVRPAAGVSLDDALRTRIAKHLRERCSPRHVPDEIVDVPAIPYTPSAKKMEVPVRRILAGADPASVAGRDQLADPAILDWYVAFAQRTPQLVPLLATSRR